MHGPRYWKDRRTPGRKDTALPRTGKRREAIGHSGHQQSATSTAEEVNCLREVTRHMCRRETKPILDQAYQARVVAFLDGQMRKDCPDERGKRGTLPGVQGKTVETVAHGGLERR